MRFSHIARYVAACSIFVAACADNPSADPVGDDPAGETPTTPDPTPPVPPAPIAVANTVSAYWSATRTPDPTYVEFAEFKLDGDAIPLDMNKMTWTPQIRVALTVQRLSCTTETDNVTFNVIEPQLATLVSHVGDDITVQLADGTQVEATKDFIVMINATPERIAVASQLTNWPELVCGVSDPLAYSMSTTSSAVMAVLPSSIYDTLDVPVQHDSWSDSKTLTLGGAQVACYRFDTVSPPTCQFTVSTPDIVAVDDAKLTYRVQASGAGLGELQEALASFHGAITGITNNVVMACADGACDLTWTQSRTAP